MDNIIVKGSFDVIDIECIKFLEEAKKCGNNENKKLFVCIDRTSKYYTNDDIKKTLSNIKIIDSVIFLNLNNTFENIIKQNNINILFSNELNDKKYKNLCNVIFTSQQQNDFHTILQEKDVKSLFLDNNRAKYLYDIMNIMDKIFRKCGVTYFAIGGTLVGAVRNQGLVPWDSDLDVGILADDIPKINGREFLELTRKNGIVMRKGSTGHVARRNNVCVDIFPFSKGTDNIYRFYYPRANKLWPRRVFNEKDLFPLKEYEFGPLKIMAAHSPDNFCTGCGFQDYRNKGIIGLSCHREKKQGIINELKKNNLHIVTNKKLLHKKYDVILDKVNI